jgi:hypothetical protein
LFIEAVLFIVHAASDGKNPAVNKESPHQQAGQTVAITALTALLLNPAINLIRVPIKNNPEPLLPLRQIILPL